MDAACEGEQLLLCHAPVRLAAQEEIKCAEAFVHVLLCEEICDAGAEQFVLLRVEEVEHHAARLCGLQAQQGGNLCAVARHEVRSRHGRRIFFEEDCFRRLGGEAQEVEKRCLLCRTQRCLEEEPRSALSRVADGEDGGDAIHQRSAGAEGGEHHRIGQCFLCETYIVPREDARGVLLLLALHSVEGSRTEVEEGDCLLRVREIRRRIEFLDEVVEIPQDVEIARHVGQIAGNFLHARRTQFRIRDAKENALCNTPLLCTVLQGVQEVRDEQDGVRPSLCDDRLHAGNELREVMYALAPQSDHRLDIVLTAQECVRLRRIAQHAHHEREELLVHTLAVRADTDGRCDRAAHGREADEVVLLDDAHDIDEVLLPPAVHCLADRLPQSLLQFPREQEFADELHEFCTA